VTTRRPTQDAPGVAARRVALEALARVEDGGAYANLVVPSILDRAGLRSDDRGLVTDLVYGTTRMRRACDAAVDRFLVTDPEPVARRALRMGAYQLLFRGVPPHAAVGATVGAVPKRARGFVNAVLRRVADAGGDVAWPDDATRLSYPDWVVERLVADLGRDDALGALAAMNEPPTVHRRDDGYTQDRASEWVVDLVGARPGEVVADLCAAPGGKTAQLALAGANVTAVDSVANRLKRLQGNLDRLSLKADVVQADVQTWEPGRLFDAILLDAPCSATGTARRHPDVPWTKTPEDVERLAALQRRLLDRAATLLKPGGRMVFANCSLLPQEGTDMIDAFLSETPQIEEDPIRADELPDALGDVIAAGRLRTTPADLCLPEPALSGLDGFFAARLRRRV
jgi:16S rRNA (cytosine967-C5)-methyltransferase